MTWVSRTPSVTAIWDGIAYGNGIFVAVSDGRLGTAEVMTSPDGITWTTQTTFSPNNFSYRDVTFGNGRFVAVGSNGKAMTSTDGITWTPESIISGPPFYNYYAVTYGNGLYVAVGGSQSRISTSTDGATWTSRNYVGGTSNLRGVAFGNGVFVAVGSDQGTPQALWSPDGITWSPATTVVPTNGWYDVEFGNGQFVAVSTDGINQVMTSSDGQIWVPRQASTSAEWRTVAYGNGIWSALAGGDSSSPTGGVVMTSTDGVTWRTGSLPVDGSWRDVVYANGQFVAVSQSGQVMTAVAQLSPITGDATVIRQGLPLGADRTCANLTDAPYAYGTGVTGGWQRAWEPWPNSGSGGWACIRAIVTTGGAWSVDNSLL